MSEAKPNSGVLVGAGYSGAKKSVFLKFYDPTSRTCFVWYAGGRHKPYCYTSHPSPSIQDRLASLNPIYSTEKKYVAIEDRVASMTKITVDDPNKVSSNEVPCVRRLIDRVSEANIRYHQCFLFDSGLIPGMEYSVTDKGPTLLMKPLPDEMESLLRKSAKKVQPELCEKYLHFGRIINQPIPHLSRMALDIEVEAEGVSPSPDRADRPIIAASFIDDIGAATVYILDRPDVPTGTLEEAKQKFTEHNFPQNIDFKFTDDELVLIRAVLKKMKEYACILTWNGDEFDLRYIFNRAIKLGVNVSEIPLTIRKGMDPQTGQNRYSVTPYQSIHLDLMKLFKIKALRIYAFGDKYQEVGLDEVAGALINKHKIQISPSQINNLQPYELGLYCLNDAALTLELSTYNHNYVINLLITLSRITCTLIEDMTRSQISFWIRNMFNLAHRERGWLIPNQADFNIKQVPASTAPIIKGKKYKGALVESESGVFFDVIALDFASLYPSIVKIKNISYETVNCKSEKHQECRTNLVPETTHWICTRRKGLFSELIGALRDLRVYYYKPASKQLEDPDDRNFMYALSQSTKVLVNASYGILGMERFQYFYLPAAEAITAWARVYITALRKKVVELGMKPIISDTDSVYLWRIQPGVEKTLSKWAEEELGVELEVDERYKYVVASGLKKNYFGVTPNGKVTVKGLTGKKRHTPPFIRELFHDIVNNTLAKVGNTDELEQAKGEIKEKLRETYRKLHNGEIPLHKMEFHYTLSKPIEDYEGNPQHVKVARLLMDRGVNVGQGSVVGYVKTVDGAIPTRFASPSRIDEKKYVDFMRSTFEQILDTLEISFDDTVYGLTKLTAFM